MAGEAGLAVSRFLVVLPPFVGHVNPTLGIADELVRRGHDVAWVGIAHWLRGFVGPHAVIYDAMCSEFVTRVDRRPADLRGAAALKYLWEDYLIPLATAMVGAVTDAARAFAPDVIVADQHALAGALVAERLGIPWATSATTSAELVQPFAPKVDAWIKAHLDALRARFGDPAATTDLRHSSELVLAYTTDMFVGQASRPVKFIGPVISGRVEDSWRPPVSDGVPTVLVTLGTANKDVSARFLTACAEAFASRGGAVRAIIADPAGHLGSQPDWITVRPHVPQLALMRHVNLVVCHAGHNTVCEALWHGVPLVVAPIRDDQQIIAEQTVTAGVGRRIRFARATAAHVGAAVDTVLADPAYRDAAAHVRHSFHAAGGAAAAADHLENVTRRPDMEWVSRGKRSAAAMN
ncbi:MAG: glycosyltransferase [Actinomycetota bacterium]|nr:glycosyltransferase [Actinomycetota bacterium]